jgi:hypothetical protein
MIPMGERHGQARNAFRVEETWHALRVPLIFLTFTDVAEGVHWPDYSGEAQDRQPVSRGLAHRRLPSRSASVGVDAAGVQA